MTALRFSLRTLAVAIAILGWLDPSYAGRSRPIIAVLDDTRATANGAASLSARVVAQLSSGAVVTTHADPDADAWVVVADDPDVAIPRPPDGVGLSLVTPPAPAASLVLEALDAPARVAPAERAPIVATFAARGLRGAESTFVVRSGSLPLATQTLRWTRDDERQTLTFDVALPAAGPNHLVVEAIEGPGRSRQSRADTVVAADASPIPVLVYEGRPSWTTTFARRAIERDARFVVSGVARVSRNIWTASVSRARPTAQSRTPTLAESLQASPSVVIVGAPETLSTADVEALRTFVTRGGVAMLAPDERPAGAYQSLIAGAPVGERLLDDASRLPLNDAPELALVASELIEATSLPPGGDELSAGTRPASASVWTAPIGRGRVVFVGALDAWRFRGQKGDAFDRWWPQLVSWLGRDRLETAQTHVEPRVAAPGEPVAVGLQAPLDGNAAIALRATLASVDTATAGRVDTPLRLWPEAEMGAFGRVINAPQRPGVYAVTTASIPVGGREEHSSAAALIVDAAARRAQPATDRWVIATTARGGVVATPAEADRVLRAAHPRAGRASDRVFPMRSLWWILPFTACLGGDWLLRRRAGLR